MRLIKLTKGQYAKVDNKDFEWLSQWKWYLSGKYAVSKISGRNVYLHRLIMDSPERLDIDHINHDKLDNQRSNLRSVTRSQNKMNTPITKANKSGVKGVWWDKIRSKWHVIIRINGKSKFLGRTESLEEAKNIYDINAKRLFGSFAYTNKDMV